MPMPVLAAVAGVGVPECFPPHAATSHRSWLAMPWSARSPCFQEVRHTHASFASSVRPWASWAAASWRLASR